MRAALERTRSGAVLYNETTGEEVWILLHDGGRYVSDFNRRYDTIDDLMQTRSLTGDGWLVRRCEPNEQARLS